MSTSIDTALSAAAADHDAGRLTEAEAGYRKVLAEHPQHPAALTRMGDVLADAGRLDEARQAYLQVIKAAPDDPATAPAYDGIAAVLQDQGDLHQAVQASRKAVELRRNPDAAYALADQLERLGLLDDAIGTFREAVALRPGGFAEAHARLGALWMARGNLTESISHYRTAIEQKPELAEAHCNLASALQLNGDENGALASVKRAIELKPDLPEAHNILGSIWQARRRPADALASYVRAVQLRPEYPESTNNAATVLEQLGRYDEATAFYMKAVTLRPEEKRFHENLAGNLLLRGDYLTGWIEHEWRRREHTNPASRIFPKPEWDGGDLNGQSIFLHAEQGIGDTIQFSRFIPLLREQRGAAHISIECQPGLVPLFRESMRGGIDEVVAQGQVPAPFDLHKPLLSLPLMFGTMVETIPNEPYLIPTPQRVAAWAEKLPKTSAKLKVGVAWAGSARHKNDRYRSLPPAMLDPIGSVEGVSFVSLQKSETTHQVPKALRLIDLTDELKDFADTAALIANLDMVISVDTAVVHLAGAMGKPTWVMIPFLPDWRWMRDRDDSPWYPSLRLFRQTNMGDWASVVERIRAALAERVASAQ